ncbi:MAG TPA: hypothetical protein VFE05_04360 [Longimicrobiaceae bacterium]|nr:hypothetical protein [Longimicrobiaceae bacterium]
MQATTDARPAAYRPGLPTGIPNPAPRPGWDVGTDRRIDDGETLARGLGWFSIGLGLAEVLAPDQLCEALGMEGKESLIRFYGLRELAAGVGILSGRKPAGWLWARVAGDALDLATLAAALDDNDKRGNVAGAIAAVAGVTLLDVICARQLSGGKQH